MWFLEKNCLIFMYKSTNKFGQYKIMSYLCTANEKIMVRLQFKERDVAQLVAHTSGGREVASSSLVIPT